jgi:hypothetical protein
LLICEAHLTEETQNSDWLQVIGKCLAYLCLSSEEGRKATGVLDKVSFLTKLGLPLSDAAALAGSSTASVKELQRQAKAKNQKAKNGRKKAKIG